MASALIRPIRTVSGNQPATRRMAEELTQTFKAGVPTQQDVATGGLQEWDGTTVSRGIAGIAQEAASNLAATGVAQTLSFGSVPNQSSAKNIPRGAPINDGRCGIDLVVEDTVFYAQVGPAQTTAATDVGKEYGMTKDADGQWYVDKTKTTIGTNTVCRVVKLDPNDTARGVHIVFVNTVAQIQG